MASGKPRSKPAAQGRPRPQSTARAKAASTKAAPAAAAVFPSALLGAGLVIGLYAMMPAVFTGGIHLRRSVEIVDHVIPGFLVLAVVVVAIYRRAQPDTLMLGAGLAVLLAGFWMAATHTGLASQALNHQVGKLGALYHCSTALAVGGLGLAWVWRYRAAGSSAAPRTRPASRRGA